MATKKKVMLAKLSRPKLHNVLVRPRLFALLDQGQTRAVTWVAGPPGAGKTALIASYLETKKLKEIWYQLDAGDHDLATFFHHLSQTIEVAKGQFPLPVLTADYLGDIPAFTRYYFREFFNRLRLPAVLVFDNYHEISRDSALHAAQEQAAQELPDGASIIVISRESTHRVCAYRRAGSLSAHRMERSQTYFGGGDRHCRGTLPTRCAQVAIAARDVPGLGSGADTGARAHETIGWRAAPDSR